MDFPLSIKTYLESKTSQKPEAWTCISEMEAGVCVWCAWPHQGRRTVQLAPVLGINYGGSGSSREAPRKLEALYGMLRDVNSL